jgi:hypothetical protein
MKSRQVFFVFAHQLSSNEQHVHCKTDKTRTQDLKYVAF